MLDEVTTGADPVVRNFVRLVAAKGRAGQLRAIAEEFEAIVDRAQGRLKVELTTAYELADDEATRSSARSSRPPAAPSRPRARSTRT